MNPRLPRPAIVIVAAMLFITGCGKPQQEKANAASQWQTVDHAEFTLKLPKDWEFTDLNSPDLDERLDEAKKNSQEVSKLSDSMNEVRRKNQFKLSAHQTTDIQEGFRENMNVIIQDATPEWKLDGLIGALKSSLSPMLADGESIQYKSVSLGGDTFGRLSYKLNVHDSDGAQRTVAYVSFSMIRGNKAVTLTFAGPGSRAEEVGKIADACLATFKLK